MEARDPDLVAKVLCGDLMEDSPEVQRALNADPELRAELEELRELQALMDLDSASERTARQGDSRVEGEASDEAQGDGGFRFRRGLLWLGSVAAAVLLVQFLIPPTSEDTGSPTIPGEGQMLGSGDLEFATLEPSGPGSSFEAFRVIAPMPAGARCEITIWDGRSGPDANPVHTYRTTVFADSPEGVTWKPKASELAKLGDDIRWEVRILDLGGKLLGRAADLKATR